MVGERLFREDLYYRLNVFRIWLPDLKDRRVDLPLLIHHILRKLCAARDNRRMELSAGTLELLLNYDYPGNVRELENILEHALIICQGDVIESRHLPDLLQGRDRFQRQRPPVYENQEGMPTEEIDRIHRALRKHNWHRQHAARELGIDRTTLWRKMKKYNLTPS